MSALTCAKVGMRPSAVVKADIKCGRCCTRSCLRRSGGSYQMPRIPVASTLDVRHDVHRQSHGQDWVAACRRRRRGAAPPGARPRLIRIVRLVVRGGIAMGSKSAWFLSGLAIAA